MAGRDRFLLDVADPAPDTRVLLFVPGALDLACALIRQGVVQVTMVRTDDLHHTVLADLAIIPEVRSASFLDHAIHSARRLLAPSGRIVIRWNECPAQDTLASVRHGLLLHGFSAARLRLRQGEAVLHAELPLCGRLACA